MTMLKWCVAGALAASAGAGNYQNQNTILDLGKKVKKAHDLEATIWEKAYKDQEDLFKWPDKLEQEYDFFKGWFANNVKLTALNKDPKSWPADVPDSPRRSASTTRSEAPAP